MNEESRNIRFHRHPGMLLAVPFRSFFIIDGTYWPRSLWKQYGAQVLPSVYTWIPASKHTGMTTFFVDGSPC